MIYSFKNSFLVFYFIRSFAPLFVLFSVLFHQFLFKDFYDSHFSISIYSLCFFILFINSFFLFFYKEKRKNNLIQLFLLFIDVLFLSGLIMTMGVLGLFFVLAFVFCQSLLYFIFNKIFEVFIFLISLSIFIPLAFLWKAHFSYMDRLSLISFINMALVFIFFFSYLLTYILNILKEDKALSSPFDVLWASRIGLSLDLARKLKPGLNSLMKYFPESIDSDKEAKTSQSFFSVKKGRQQLEQMRQFILDFIEYAEPDTEFFLEEPVDIKKLLTKVFNRMEKHPQRPADLNQQLQIPFDLMIKASSSHLEKSFEHILLNSFEALKNKEKPWIKVVVTLKSSWFNIEFLDNGHGIQSEDMKRLFEPLFSQRFGLKGLGLAYVQKVVKVHKARLDIQSSKEGTKVLIQFPLIPSFYDDTLFKDFKNKRKKKVV